MTPPASSAATARSTSRGWGCSGSIARIGAGSAIVATITRRDRPHHPGSTLPASLLRVVLSGVGSALAFLDQLAHLLATLATDLLVERRPTLGLDGLAALFADLL